MRPSPFKFGFPSAKISRDRVSVRRVSSKVAEERRLLYVAMTRANSQLTLVMPNSSRHVKQTVAPLGNRRPTATRSRFITNACLPLFDQRDVSHVEKTDPV